MKKKSVLYTCWLAMVLLHSSCIHNEEDYISKFCPGSCTIIRGKIATANGTVPLPGIQLSATWSNVGGVPISGGTIRRKAIAYTDANGNYELRFLLRDDELIDGSLRIETSIDETEYLTCGARQPIYYPADDLPRDTTLVMHYVLPRKATLVLQLENPEALMPGDEIYQSVTYIAGVNKNTCRNVVSWYKGAPQSVDFVTAAEQPVVVKTTKTKNGVRTTASETFVLSPGQRSVFRVSF